MGFKTKVLVLFVALFSGAVLGLAVAGRVVWAAGGPTRSDLDQLRRRLALLESELVLARSRKPYVVVDSRAKCLRYRLLGVTMREIPASDLRIDGLRRTGDGGADGSLALAAIVTIKAKEKDPRLTPLTPEQIESGVDDENVADALPPEAPPDFNLQFKQSISLHIEGIAGKGGGWSAASSWWQGLWSELGPGRDRTGLRLWVHLEETAAREVYRSLIPGLRLVLVPPDGFILPDVGQESPRAIRQGRPARPQVPQPGAPPQGVPFRIPPPVVETLGEEGTSTGEAAGAPAESPTPAAEVASPVPIPEATPVEEPPADAPPDEEASPPPPGAGGGA